MEKTRDAHIGSIPFYVGLFVLIYNMTIEKTGSMTFGFLVLSTQGIQWENLLIAGGQLYFCATT